MATSNSEYDRLLQMEKSTLSVNLLLRDPPHQDLRVFEFANAINKPDGLIPAPMERKRSDFMAWHEKMESQLKFYDVECLLSPYDQLQFPVMFCPQLAIRFMEWQEIEKGVRKFILACLTEDLRRLLQEIELNPG